MTSLHRGVAMRSGDKGERWDFYVGFHFISWTLHFFLEFGRWDELDTQRRRIRGQTSG